jgi:hypothetical protein
MKTRDLAKTERTRKGGKGDKNERMYRRARLTLRLRPRTAAYELHRADSII